MLQLCQEENYVIHSVHTGLGLLESLVAFRKAQMITPPRRRGFVLWSRSELSLSLSRCNPGARMKILERFTNSLQTAKKLFLSKKKKKTQAVYPKMISVSFTLHFYIKLNYQPATDNSVPLQFQIAWRILYNFSKQEAVTQGLGRKSSWQPNRSLKTQRMAVSCSCWWVVLNCTCSISSFFFLFSRSVLL